MKKDMFFCLIPEINVEICATLCYGEVAKKRFAEDEFGNHIYIDNKGRVVAWMHEYEPEDYIISNSLSDFYNTHTFYDFDEVIKIINDKYPDETLTNKEHEDFFVALYEAKAVIGKDFIDLTYKEGDQCNVSKAFKNVKITEEELFKLENFSPSYLKEANKINNEKKLKNQK